MIWLAWRQFRIQALAALAVVAAAASYLVVTGLRMHHTYAADLASCSPRNECAAVLGQFQSDYTGELNFAELLLIVAPALIGIFWGAPLIGRELETNTHQLAWNQSVTRTRWLAVKLALIATVSVVSAGILSYMLTWWAAPLDQVNGGRFAGIAFSTRDIVPLAYAAFAFALGTTLGLLLRRTIPAMAVTLAVFIGIQILVPTVIRPNLLPSTTAVFPIDQATTGHANGIMSNGGNATYIEGLSVPQGAWVLSTTPVEEASGQQVGLNTINGCLPNPGTRGNGVDPFTQFGACVASDNLHESITYQPASHYWPLQWYETGIFLALAGGLSGFCFWWIRRRQN